MGLLSVVRRPSVRPSVRGTIFFEPNARSSFKSWLLLPLVHTPRLFFHFWKKKFGGFFMNIFLFR